MIDMSAYKIDAVGPPYAICPSQIWRARLHIAGGLHDER